MREGRLAVQRKRNERLILHDKEGVVYAIVNNAKETVAKLTVQTVEGLEWNREEVYQVRYGISKCLERNNE